MSWLQLHIDIEQQYAEQCENILLDFSALSVTFKDQKDHPILEPERGTTPFWPTTKLTALFSREENETLEAIKILSIKNRLHEETGISSMNVEHEILEEKIWERECLQYFSPIHCGGDLWICPSWQTAPEPEAINLLLDPGLAFGTGTHETTRLCLEWLAINQINNKTIIDYGCGSGILGIAGLLLGAKHAIFIDNDPQALIASEENLSKNKISKDKYELVLVESDNSISLQESIKCDILLANILAKPLIDLCDRICGHIMPKGVLLLSGIQNHQEDDIKKAYQNMISFDYYSEQNEWLCLGGIKKPV